MTIAKCKLTAVCRSLLLAALLSIAASCASVDKVRTTDHIALDESKAMLIARDEFNRYTRGEVKKVSMSRIEETRELWIFRVAGKDEFARPGFHWHIKVNKVTGATEVIPGE